MPRSRLVDVEHEVDIVPLDRRPGRLGPRIAGEVDDRVDTLEEIDPGLVPDGEVGYPDGSVTTVVAIEQPES